MDLKTVGDFINAVGIGNALTVILMIFFLRPLANKHFSLVDSLTNTLINDVKPAMKEHTEHIADMKRNNNLLLEIDLNQKKSLTLIESIDGKIEKCLENQSQCKVWQAKH